MVTRNRWKILIGIALAFGTQEAFTGEAWLVIASDPPGAAVSVDGAYRGVTPQHPGDVLRIQVSEGVREIKARVQVDGKDYVARQTVKARGNGETVVRLKLRTESTPTSVIPATSAVHASKLGCGWRFPVGNVEVPGRNF